MDTKTMVVWLMCILFALITSLSVATCHIRKDTKIAGMVAAGASPIEARLSLSNNATTSELVTALFLRREQQKASETSN